MTELVSYTWPVPRRRPPSRLADLADAAIAVFIERGYRRTQIADVAAALGVAKGTVYLYVESKEALFDLAVRRAAGALGPAEPALPLPAPAPADTLRFVEEHLRRAAALPRLTRAAERRGRMPVRAEVEAVLQELYDTLEASRVGMKLIDRCAADYPDLAAVWFSHGRLRAQALLERCLTLPARRRALRAMPVPAVTARIVLEVLTFWAVHRYWDPAPMAIEPAQAREAAVGFALAALVRGPR